MISSSRNVSGLRLRPRRPDRSLQPRLRGIYGVRGRGGLGRDARETVIPQEEREAFGGVLDHVWATGRPDPRLGHWRTRDDRRRLIAWANKPVCDETGTARYLF